MQLNETLLAGDLRNLISPIFEVDAYSSKMGSDQEIAVLSFTVESKEPAVDLVNFVERGFDFVLDADVTAGELNDGRYKVFVEIERSRRLGAQILEMLHGIKELTAQSDFKFRLYKSFHSLPVNEENLKMIPTSKDEYDRFINEASVNNFSTFFNRSYLESINIDNDDLVFQKMYSGPLRLKIVDAGPTKEIYAAHPEPIMIESSAMSEVMFLTKYLGNYNITKLGADKFVLENNNFSVVVKR